ncbi:MAG: hypothetical protein EA379_11700 [Phycisphaerales bacterium]|nr:MAG: hypothetical protein EA379_11700 [Phycisphaerales bacterium]
MHDSRRRVFAALTLALYTTCAHAQVTVVNRSTGQPPANLSGHDTTPYHVSFDAQSLTDATYDVRWTSTTSFGSIGSITINDIHPDVIIRLDPIEH